MVHAAVGLQLSPNLTTGFPTCLSNIKSGSLSEGIVLFKNTASKEFQLKQSLHIPNPTHSDMLLFGGRRV